MRHLRSILFATDLRSTNRDIADVAIKLATAAKAHINLLHVLEPVARWAPTPGAILSGIAGAFHAEPTFGSHDVTLERRKVSETSLQDVANYLTSSSVPLSSSKVEVGPVADTIVQTANTSRADLILMGAGERFREERFSVGPVAMSVIEHAAQPVLAVRTGSPMLTFRKILCPVDHSPPSARGLRNAIRLARSFGGELVVLSVVPEVSWWTAAEATGDFRHALAEHAQQWRAEFDHFLSGFDFQGVSMTHEVQSGVPHREIGAAAQQHQADLIVMGATGRSGLVRILLGSTTRRVLQELPCSLLSVKDEEI